MLDEEEKLRYKRHFLLPGWNESSQEKLKNTTVFVAGAGGLGSPTLTMLALMGVGKIRICDFDVFEQSNKNRQFIHCFDENRVGMNKAQSAAKSVCSINPNVKVEFFEDKITCENVNDIVGDADYIFDCVDNFRCKFILADCAERKNIPMFFYGIMDYNCFGYIFYPPRTACFRCLFDESKIKIFNRLESKPSEIAAMSPALFTAAGLMVNQAMKMIIDHDKPIFNTMYVNFGKQNGINDGKGVKGFKFWNTDYFNRISLQQGFDWKNKNTADMMETIFAPKNPKCNHCKNM